MVLYPINCTETVNAASLIFEISKIPSSFVMVPVISSPETGVGFDWEHPDQVWEKVEEELGELKVEIENKNQDAIEDEFGDLLFSLINYARFLKINPENALERTNKKFIKRFQYLETKAKALQKPLSAANSSVRLKRNTPFGALPTAVLYAFTMYAVFIVMIFILK